MDSKLQIVNIERQQSDLPSCLRHKYMSHIIHGYCQSADRPRPIPPSHPILRFTSLVRHPQLE